MGENIPEMSGYKARSFWLMFFATVIPIARALGFDPAVVGLDDEALTNLVLLLLPVVLAIWAYIERLYGKHRLIFKRRTNHVT